MDTGMDGSRELPAEITTSTDTRDILARAGRYVRDPQYKDWLFIDVDAHHSEMASWNEVLDYVPDPVLQYIGKQFSGRTSVSGGKGGSHGLSNRVAGTGYQDVGGRIPHQQKLGEEVEDTSVHRDVTLVRRCMEALGLDYQILFPGNMLQLGLHPQPRVEVTLSWAYNRFLTERILTADDRIKSMLYLPMSEPEECVQIIEEFGDCPGVIGFLVTAVRYKPVHHNQFMKIYAMLEERGLPLAFHAGPNWQDDYLKQLDQFISMHAVSFVLCNMVHLTNWVLHGLGERFPKLNVMWIESGTAWIPFMMQRLDNEYLMRSSEAPLLKRLPSEYMREMYYTSQPLERTNLDLLEATFKAMKADTQLLYASDWPHWDFDAPNSILELPFLDDAAKRNILGENADRLFGMTKG